MRWKPGRRSRNLEDRRAETGGRGRGGFRLPRIPMGGGGRGRLPRIPMGGGRSAGGGFSLTTLLIMLAVLYFFGGDALGPLLGGGGPLDAGLSLPDMGSVSAKPPGQLQTTASEEELVDFVSFVLDDVQNSWPAQLPNYRDAKLVLFRDGVRSGCGFAQSQMGPFYCPADEKVYIDLSFYEEMRSRFGAPGDFAQAYVLAHEIGHHIQKVEGIEAQVRRQQKASPSEANQLSVRMELQADCLAGVWAYGTAQRGILEPGDLEEGLTAAAAIGDDRLQKQATGRVQPESFTHGTSAQRVAWLRRGAEAGDASVCNTFKVARP